MCQAGPRLFAGAHAPAARVGADPAMFMHLSVFFTFLAAEPARRCTGIEHSSDHLLVGPGSAGRDPPGDVADVCAVHIQSDALGQGFYIVFRKTRVGARRACLRTGVALLDAANEGVVCIAANLRMRADHCLSLH